MRIFKTREQIKYRQANNFTDILSEDEAENVSSKPSGYAIIPRGLIGKKKHAYVSAEKLDKPCCYVYRSLAEVYKVNHSIPHNLVIVKVYGDPGYDVHSCEHCKHTTHSEYWTLKSGEKYRVDKITNTSDPTKKDERSDNIDCHAFPTGTL